VISRLARAPSTTRPGPAVFALDGTPHALALTSPKRDEREVCLELVERCERTVPLIVIGDKGFCLEPHGARTLHGLRARISQRLLALAAGVAPNHHLGRPSRALVNYSA
jgi:hypothetical protein